MKRVFVLFLALLLSCTLFSCDTKKTDQAGIQITDDLGNAALLSKNARVAAGYASFGECWQLAGGALVGITSDALEEGRILGAESLSVIGSVKSIDLELLVALDVDYLILSADLVAHTELDAKLRALGIPHGYFKVDTFDDYASLMVRFCAVTEREDLYAKNVTEVGDRIKAIMEKIPKNEDRTVLLMRAFSTGIKAKRDDNLAGQILKEFGLFNIADSSPSLLENLSVEHIIKSDPDFVFVLTMGSEESARAYLKNNVESNPAWSGLTAVKNESYEVLPKELFHYKPNNRWDESYEYIAKAVYPELFE